MRPDSEAAVQIIVLLVLGGFLAIVGLQLVVFYLFKRSRDLLLADFERRMQGLEERAEGGGSIAPRASATSIPPESTSRVDPSKQGTTSSDEWQKAREADGATIQRTRDGRGQVAIGG